MLFIAHGKGALDGLFECGFIHMPGAREMVGLAQGLPRTCFRASPSRAATGMPRFSLIIWFMGAPSQVITTAAQLIASTR